MIHLTAAPHGYDCQATVAQIGDRFFKSQSTDFGVDEWADITDRFHFSILEALELVKPLDRPRGLWLSLIAQLVRRWRRAPSTWDATRGRWVEIYVALPAEAAHRRVQGLLTTTPVVSRLDQLLVQLGPQFP
ncbi:MAG: hypothetical protein AAGM22_33770 [Acidobacteriota bacterium]